MKGRLLVLAFLLLTTVHLPAQQVQVREETLSNGMRLLLVERHDSPSITCAWVARVGSVNERPGITGISHLFEHMMFKGTRTIGVTDYEQAKALQDRQDAIWAEMQQEYNRLRQLLLRGEISGNIYAPENRTPRLQELRGELEELFAREKELITKNELDQIYTRQGGSNLNAFTTQDQTVYMVTVPANKLELWFWLESDRLSEPVFREFYSERDVVREERRLRVESTPTGELDEQFDAMFWQSSPYSWPIIGWASDVESITRAQAEEYFDTYYAPNNLTAILVGDFDSDEVVSLAKRYFDRIPRGEQEPPAVVTLEVEQKAEQRLVGEADTNPTVFLRFQAPPFNHKDSAALNVVADLLNGRTGRLYKSLVEERELAVGQPFASYNENKYGGYFQLGAEVKEGVPHQAVEAALLEELARLQETPVPAEELQKVKNQELANSFRRLQNNFFLMIQLAIYDSNGRWQYLNELPGKVARTTPDDLRQVSREYFKQERRSVGWYLRKEGSTPDPPELSSLPPQMKAAIKQQLQQVAAETDTAKLQAALAQTQQMAGQVPPDFKPAVDLMLRSIQERLDALSQEKGDQ